jgi:hypothetical protein
MMPGGGWLLYVVVVVVAVVVVVVVVVLVNFCLVMALKASNVLVGNPVLVAAYSHITPARK